MSIEFARRVDGLVYRYRRDGEFNGRPSGGQRRYSLTGCVIL